MHQTFDLLKRTAAENGPFSNKTCSTSYSGPSHDAQVKWFVLLYGVDHSASTVMEIALQL